MSVTRLRYRLAALIDQKRIATGEDERRPRAELWLPDNGTGPVGAPTMRAVVRIFDPIAAARFMAEGDDDFTAMRRAELTEGAQRTDDDDLEDRTNGRNHTEDSEKTGG